MSSTNRGYDRHKADYYVTPKVDVEQFLYQFQYTVLDIDSNSMSELNWLDPCCGGDKFNDPSYVSVIKDFFDPEYLCGIDIREDSKADVITDYLTVKDENMDKHDVIISNPPSYLAEEFIKKSLGLVKEDGYVIMLLRLNFFGSKKRKKLFENNMPEYCFIHHKRINFIPDNVKAQMKSQGINPPSGDSIEYAHFVWKKGANNEYCKTYVI